MEICKLHLLAYGKNSIGIRGRSGCVCVDKSVCVCVCVRTCTCMYVYVCAYVLRLPYTLPPVLAVKTLLSIS